MAIKDLLERIKNNKEENEIEFKSIKEIDAYKLNEKLEVRGVLFDPRTLSSMDSDTLNAKYDEVYSWTQTHFCQTGTDNKLDINNRPYDHDLWVEHDELLKLIAIEMLNRPLYENLRESRQ